MKEKMKKAGLIMSTLMALVMSFFLSLINNLLSGKFSFVLFLITLLRSFVVSFIIGLVVPMPLISMGIAKKMKGSGGCIKLAVFQTRGFLTMLPQKILLFQCRFTESFIGTAKYLIMKIRFAT